MKPIFSIHAGEYLVGSYIEKQFKNLSVWLPTKDTGIDLLVTDQRNKKAVSVQVKFSKDFLTMNRSDVLRQELKAIGWWSLNSEKIRQSDADLWVFVLCTLDQKKFDFIVIPPRDLLKRFQRIHGKERRIQTYFAVTKKGKCWETRNLKKADQERVALEKYKNTQRDFTQYLNNWVPLSALVR